MTLHTTKNRGTLAVASALALAMSLTATQAAFLVEIQGNVQVDRGSGLQAVNASTTVQAGTRVKAASNSSAVIRHPNCDQVVRAGTTVIVAEDAACKVVTTGALPEAAVGAEAGLGAAETAAAVGLAAAAGVGIYAISKAHGHSR